MRLRWIGLSIPLLAVFAAIVLGSAGAQSFAQQPGWLDRPPGGSAVASCPGPEQWLLVYWGGANDAPIATAAGTCANASIFWARRGSQWLGFRKDAQAASDTWGVVTGEAHFVLGGSGGAPSTGSWLDQAKPTNWNQAGAAIPAAPAPQGDPATVDRCSRTIRQPATAEELAVSGKGWTLFREPIVTSPPSLASSVTVIEGMASVDGMCRPWQYQGFVFYEGKFAGTLSPDVMDAREDGSLREILSSHEFAIAAMFNRYKSSDPLCCPSGVSTVQFSLDRSGATPLVKPEMVTTGAPMP